MGSDDSDCAVGRWFNRNDWAITSGASEAALDDDDDDSGAIGVDPWKEESDGIDDTGSADGLDEERDVEGGVEDP
jgi:hypothetical protein